MSWTPGEAEEERALQLPRDGAPSDVIRALKTWLRSTFLRDRYMFYRVLVWTQAVPGDPRDGLSSSFSNAWTRTSQWIDVQPTRALDLIHHVLVNRYVYDAAAEELDDLLLTLNSAYRVREDFRGLEQRLPEGIADQVRTVVGESEGSVSKLLTDAWNHAYGYDKNPVHSYDQTYRAVEVALRPIIAPKDAGCSLTKMIGLLAQGSAKFQFQLHDARTVIAGTTPPPAADGVSVVLDLMRLLAYGQKERHGGIGGPTEEDARAAVMIAVTLIAFANSQAFSRI